VHILKFTSNLIRVAAVVLRKLIVLHYVIIANSGRKDRGEAYSVP